MRNHQQSAREALSQTNSTRHRARPARQKSGISTILPDIEQVLRLVRTDYPRAVLALRRRSDAAEQSVSEMRRLTAAAVFERARILETNKVEWERFVAEGIPGRKNQLKREDCLRYAFLHMYGNTKTCAARARDHERALRAFWDEGLSARKVYEELQEHSLDDLKTPASVASRKGLKGRKPIPLEFGKRGQGKVDALAFGESGIAIFKKVRSGSKSSLLVNRTNTNAALVEKVSKMMKRRPARTAVLAPASCRSRQTPKRGE